MFRCTLALFLGYFMVVQFAMAERSTTFLHTDALGSVVAASDDGGTVIWRKVYEPYGNQIGSDTNDEILAFTGKPEEDTGLSYFGARYYDPQAGRFMGIDPVGVLGQADSNPLIFNRFAYGNNNPYKYVDPDGRASALAACIGGPIACAVGVGLTVVTIQAVITTTQSSQNSGGQSGPFAPPSGGAGTGDPCSSFPGLCGSRDEEKQERKENAYHGRKPEYENPGHHDPSSPNFRGSGDKTTFLPKDAHEVYKRAIPTRDGKTWYRRNSNGEFYRYQGSNGKVHWNGRQNSGRGLKVPRYIRDRFKDI